MSTNKGKRVFSDSLNLSATSLLTVHYVSFRESGTKIHLSRITSQRRFQKRDIYLRLCAKIIFGLNGEQRFCLKRAKIASVFGESSVENEPKGNLIKK